MESAMRETVALSRAMGTGLEEADVAAWYETLRRLAPDGKTSMLQDVEARRRTEVEAFAGTVMGPCPRAGLRVSLRAGPDRPLLTAQRERPGAPLAALTT